MARNPDPNPDLDRIVLPGGKTIEVLRLAPPEPAAPGGDPGPEAQGPREGGAPPGDDRAEAHPPHLCSNCRSSLVYPVAWEPAAGESWTVEVRCPNCEQTRTTVLGHEAAERFDEELERGAETLMDDLARLAEANMTEDVERFAAALAADAIEPSDF